MHGNQRQAPWILSYIAGLLDGEGSFMITKSKSTSIRKSPTYTPRIKCSMTVRYGLDFIAKRLKKGKVKFEGVRKSRPNRKPIYKWEVCNKKDCKAIAELLYPYMLVKREAALHLLDFCRITMENPVIVRYGFCENELHFREDAYLKMRKLNKVGAAATTYPQALERVK